MLLKNIDTSRRFLTLKLSVKNVNHYVCQVDVDSNNSRRYQFSFEHRRVQYTMQEQNTVYLDLIITSDAAFGSSYWSHEVVSQTLDFVNRRENSFTVGCSTVIKVQLDSGRHHQDFGYSETTARTEGLAILRARTSSCTNAFRRTLLAFHETRIRITGNSSSSSSEPQEDTSKETRLAKQKEKQNMWFKRRRLEKELNACEENSTVNLTDDD